MANYCTNCGSVLSEKGKFCGNCGMPYQDKKMKQQNKKHTSKKKVIGIISILLILTIAVVIIILVSSKSSSPQKLLESKRWCRSYGTEKTECIYFDTVYINIRKDLDEIGSTKQVATYTVESDNTIVAKYNTHVSSHTFIPLNEKDIANGLFDISDDDWSVTEHFLVYNGKVYMDEEYYWDHYYDDYDE